MNLNILEMLFLFHIELSMLLMAFHIP